MRIPLIVLDETSWKEKHGKIPMELCFETMEALTSWVVQIGEPCRLEYDGRMHGKTLRSKVGFPWVLIYDGRGAGNRDE